MLAQGSTGAGMTGDQHYRAIFEAAGVGIATLTLDGHFVEVNQRFAEITGRQREDLVGLHFQDISHPDETPVNQATMETLLNGQQDRLTREKRYVRPNGDVVYAMLNAVLLKDKLGRPQHIVSVIEDIGERLRMQEALSSARTAERASKAKTEFLSRMSHELRTPLNAILGFAQLLKMSTREPLGAEQWERVDVLERAGRHLLALVNDVLDLSRIEAGHMALHIGAMGVRGVFDEVFNLVISTAHANRVTLHRPDWSQLADPLTGPLAVRADMLRLQQVLVNLAGNAIKFTPAGKSCWASGWSRRPSMA